MILVACVFVFVSCDTKDDVTYYQETVVGKYGDGISLIGTVTPQGEISEYADLPRVEKAVCFDTRLEGWHFCGVYVVRGEKITVTLPEEKADGSVVATVGRYEASANAYSVPLDEPTVTFESPVSGLLEVDLGDCYGDEFWTLTVSGVVAASYFRLGLDRVADWKNSAGYAVVDATNVRIYLPAQYIDSADDVAKAASWWRSFCEYADGYTTGIFGEDKLSPTDIYVGGNVSQISYDKEKDVLFLPSDLASVMLDAEALSHGAAWDAMLGFCKGKALYAGFDAADEVAQIIAAGAFVTLTDSVLGTDSGDEYWINNAYDCLRRSLAGELSEYGDLAVYVNLIHSFGEKEVAETAVGYAVLEDEDGSEAEEKPSLAQYFCNTFAQKGIDLEPYMNGIFGLSVEQTLSDATVYVPVQSAYAIGASAGEDKTGVTVNSGERVGFDFAGAVVTSAEKVELVEVRLGDKEWKAGEGGLYEYKPVADVKEQNFTLVFEADGVKTELHGRFTCNVAVSVFSRYENVPWRDMKTAVKEYGESGDKYLVSSSAVFKAEVPQNDEVDDGVYTFSVNNGVIQVDETATYVVYVRSKGMTRVDFGVPQYMFTMFENTLTVNEYTDLLCYEIELQEGVSYYYDIYILATKGNAYACLGISKKGEQTIEDVDDGYLVYYPFDRDDIQTYSAPELVPQSFGVSREGGKNFEDLGTKLVAYPKAEQGSSAGAACDGNDDTYFTSKPALTHTYVYEFDEAVQADYLILRTNNSGVGFELAVSEDGTDYTVCDDGILNKNINRTFVKPVAIKYVRLTMTSDVEFASVVKDIYCGVYTKEATIVPSNSSRVLYQGKWQYKTGGISVNGWILESYGDDAAIEFNFYGTAISIYCATGDVYGSMQIYADGKQCGLVDLYSRSTQYNRNVFSIDFNTAAKHTIRIVPSSNDDIINLDYFSVVYAEQHEATPEVGNLWYFAIIPAALAAVFAVCAALDISERRKKKRKKQTADVNADKQE